MKLDMLKTVMLHPHNSSYPIFTVELNKFGMGYVKKCDCDHVDLTIENLQVFDNTDFPNTLDPS